MIGFAKKKRASIAGGEGGRTPRGGVLGLNLNNVGGDSLSSLSSRSGMNSARGHHPTPLIPNLDIQPNAEAASSGTGGD